MPRGRRFSATHELFELLIRVPAWVGPLLALSGFLLLFFLVPLFFRSDGSNALASGMAPVFVVLSKGAACVAGGAVLLVWIVAEFMKRARPRLLDSQDGLDDIRHLPWQQFESLVAEAYHRQGYDVEHTADSSPDGGVDLILRENEHTILVQCKQWRERQLGVRIARELLGVVASEKATSGILVTSGQFTAEARRFAEGNSIELIDGPALAALVADVRRAKADATAKPPAAPSPHKPQPAVPQATPTCPKCGSPMVVRTAGRGPNAGSKFWGCSTYPRCKGTRPAE
jgi:restriction system protein